MFVVIHPADADDRDVTQWRPLIYLVAAVIVMIGLFLSRVAAIVLALAALGYLQWQRMRSARKWNGWESWPVTESTIEMVEVREVRRRGNPPSFIGELAYSYHAQNQYYSGYCRCAFQDRKEATDFVDARRGKQIPVHFKPDTPEVSIMSGQDL